MKNKFELVHVGINNDSLEEAQKLRDTLCLLLNLEPRDGKKSVFAGKEFECLRERFLGTNGHVAMQTEDLEAAVCSGEDQRALLDLNDYRVTLGDPSGSAYALLLCDSDTLEVLGYLPIE